MYVRFVLVRPLYAINIGMAARTLKNFGFDDMAFVEPESSPCHPQAFQYSMTAKSILEEAPVYSSIEEATAGFDITVATTHTGGKARPLLIPLPDLAEHLAGRPRVAVLFGSEGGGLRPEELHSVDLATTIPTVEGKAGSLNLAQSVAVVAYELSRKEETRSPDTAQLAALEDFLEKALYQRKFFSAEDHLPGPTHLRRMLRRMAPDNREGAFLFALFKFLLDEPR
ncbi:MAG TPA: RNA methyltransferase [Thermoanaerobaculia bacterium]|nr:RNA methyltransferase [Thermoanaerobaculia bacterium]HUM29820.1 RNA methyltransferase [Thermoanaerobaculia bacterium]HXK68095.1 RNA methyltransferase [Thermoanaerobaculia bacterium]